MTQDYLEYPKLVEHAMRGVVRKALADVMEYGLRGLHHFYVTFRTQDQNVIIPERLLAQYPDEMTIVMENQFRNLLVEENQFKVTLSFNGTPENLSIPYSAITAFVDPSVKFGLQFDSDNRETVNLPTPTKETFTQIDNDTYNPEEEEGQVVALDKFRKK